MKVILLLSSLLFYFKSILLYLVGTSCNSCKNVSFVFIRTGPDQTLSQETEVTVALSFLKSLLDKLIWWSDVNS